MALLKFGGGITEMRGSIAGNVYSRNRYGAYARARTTPVNPASQRQSAIRALISDISQAWFNTLTQAQRDAWNVFAAAVPEKNKLGEVIYLSGFNQYCKSNLAAQNAGLPAIAEAPTIFTKPGEDTSFAVSASAATQLVSVTFDDTLDWVDEDDAGMIIRVGSPQNGSINYFDGPWRFADSIDGDGTTAPTTPADVASPFVLAEDQKVFVEGRIIRADGRLSDWFRGDCTCGA